jgi:hypothetical protein
MDNLVPLLCPTLLVRTKCDEAQCPYVHLSDFQITTSALLSLDDKFSEHQKPHDPAEDARLSAYDRKILQAPRPALCWVCCHPIDPDTGFHCACCDIFSCAACADRWPFSGHCPRCGTEAALAPLLADKHDDVAARNAAILVPKVVPSLGS